MSSRLDRYSTRPLPEEEEELKKTKTKKADPLSHIKIPPITAKRWLTDPCARPC